MVKSFETISWNVTEEEYRADSALSYSTLAKYERTGFNGLPTLFDKIESPSLLLGSAVDSIITGGESEFNERFIVCDFPSIPDSIISIVKTLFNKYSDSRRNINMIDDSIIINTTEEVKYQLNWKPETRAKVIKEKGEEYYNLLALAGNKTIINTELYSTIQAMVNALRTSDSTKYYFANNNPFENVKRYYQLKFKATLEGIDYRCMADLIIVDYDNKVITLVDLKTSFKKEYDFYKSFIEWDYQIQARLYWQIIRANMDKDDYFKDFKLTDYKFIVVSRDCNPLVWNCPFTQAVGTLRFGKKEQIEMRHPFDIGKELYYYLSSGDTVPVGINRVEDNDLRIWLNRL